MSLTQGEYSDYFYNQDDTTARSDTGRKTGDYRVVALANGTWAVEVKDNFGTGYSAGKLPTFTVNGSAVQEQSVAGFKLFGVSKYSKNVKWATELANFLTSEDAEASRFTTLGSGPSNKVAASSDAVKANVGLSGLIEQSAYGITQSVSGNFWDPSGTLAAALYAGKNGDTDLITSGRGTANIVFDDTAVQALLDDAVAAIAA